MKCPTCKTPLTKERVSDWEFVFVCRTCRGRSIGMPVLRRRFEKDVVNDLWRRARAAARRGERPCPACGLPMAEVVVTRDGRETTLDACSFCFLLWFDVGEMEALPPKPIPSVREPSAQELRDLFQDDFEVEQVDPWSRDALPGWLGIPTKYGGPQRSVVPFVTWGLSAVLLALTLVPMARDLLHGDFWGGWRMSSTLREMALAWGFIPAEASRHGGLTWISCFFLHGGFLHVLGNVYFLNLTGTDCEGLLGRGRYLLLLLVSVLVGSLTHRAVDPSSTIPAIGASGGISGLLAWYALAFPKVRVGLMLWGWWYDLYRLRMPVRWAFALWVLLQLSGFLLPYRYRYSGVAYAAHLGGAFAGVAWWFLFDRRRTAETAA